MRFLIFSLTIFSLSIAFPLVAKETPSINELINLKHDATKGNGPIEGGSKDSLRLDKIKETAMFLGIQAGFNNEIKRIHSEISKADRSLDALFDFGMLMRSTNSGIYEAFLLPAVVNEIKGKVRISDDGKNISYTDRSFEILDEEKFVTEQPNWRSYLLLNPLKEYQPPFNSLLPKTEAEQEIWAVGLKEGIKLGVIQANKEVAANALNLGRDFIGMAKYIRGTLEGLIESPSLSFSRELMETDGKILDINKTSYQISSPAKFNSDTGKWEIITTSTRESLRNF